MQYFTEHGRIDALRDLLKGPEDLHKVLGTKLPEINALKAQYPDAQLKEDVDDFPAPKIGRGPMGGHRCRPAQQEATDPVGHQDRCAPAHQGAGTGKRRTAPGYLAHRDNRWYRVAHYDSVVVSNAEGTGALVVPARPEEAEGDARRKRPRCTPKLFREWDSLAEQYRSAVADISSIEAWKKTFEANSEDGS